MMNSVGSAEILLVLDAVDHGLSIDSLERLRLPPARIGAILDYCIRNELLYDREGEEALTSMGHALLVEDRISHGNYQKHSIIVPFYTMRIPQSKLQEVYIPDAEQRKWFGQAR